MKEQKLNVVCLDSYSQFFGINVQIGYDVIYWFEDSEGWIVCDKVFEPLYLPQFFNILIQLFHVVDWVFILSFLDPFNKNISESIQTGVFRDTLSHEMFNNLLNLKNLPVEQQIKLFKDLYSTEVFQKLAVEKYGSFVGFLELISFFEEKGLYNEQQKVIDDMIFSTMTHYIDTYKKK